MDAEGRAKQEARAENNYIAHAPLCIKTKQTAAKTNSKDQQTLTHLSLIIIFATIDYNKVIANDSFW